MKKIYFSFLCCLIGLLTQAQNTFAPLGAEWWYLGTSSSQGGFHGVGVLHMKSIGDTLILNKQARKLEETIVEHRYFLFHDQPNASDTIRNTWYVYNNEDTVFCYNNRVHDFTPCTYLMCKKEIR
jgi:hypothetical protein